MLRLLAAVGLGGFCLLGLGCAMCASCDDYNYAAYGGVRPRMDMGYGRVGSVFAPADGETTYHEPTHPQQQLDAPPEPPPQAYRPTGRSVMRPQEQWQPY